MTSAVASDRVVDALVLGLLSWIGVESRACAEVMKAWRTSCPRLPVWGEANLRGLRDAFAGVLEDGFGAELHRIATRAAGLGRGRPLRARGRHATPAARTARTPVGRLGKVVFNGAHPRRPQLARLQDRV